MPLTLERSYAAAVDFNLPDVSTLQLMYRSTLWAIKAALKNTVLTTGIPTSSAWAVDYSCDSVTAGAAGDGVDRWGDTFDGTKIVRAAAGTAHSWMVLKHASLGYWACIDYSGAADNNVVIAFSKTAFTGGTTTGRPASTSEFAMALTTFWDAGYAAGTAKIHKCVTSGGEFILLWGRTGTNRMAGALALQAVTDTFATDSTPMVGIFDSAATTVNPLNQENSFFSSAATPGMRSRSHNNAANIHCVPLIPRPSQNSATSFYGTSWMPTTDASDGKYVDESVRLAVITSPYIGFKGRLIDWRLCGHGIAEGTMFQQADLSLSHVKIGGCWLPFTVAPSL